MTPLIPFLDEINSALDTNDLDKLKELFYKFNGPDYDKHGFFRGDVNLAFSVAFLESEDPEMRALGYAALLKVYAEIHQEYKRRMDLAPGAALDDRTLQAAKACLPKARAVLVQFLGGIESFAAFDEVIALFDSLGIATVTMTGSNYGATEYKESYLPDFADHLMAIAMENGAAAEERGALEDAIDFYRLAEGLLYNGLQVSPNSRPVQARCAALLKKDNYLDAFTSLAYFVERIWESAEKLRENGQEEAATKLLQRHAYPFFEQLHSLRESALELGPEHALDTVKTYAQPIFAALSSEIDENILSGIIRIAKEFEKRGRYEDAYEQYSHVIGYLTPGSDLHSQVAQGLRYILENVSVSDDEARLVGKVLTTCALSFPDDDLDDSGRLCALISEFSSYLVFPVLDACRDHMESHDSEERERARVLAGKVIEAALVRKKGESLLNSANIARHILELSPLPYSAEPMEHAFELALYAHVKCEELGTDGFTNSLACFAWEKADLDALKQVKAAREKIKRRHAKNELGGSVTQVNASLDAFAARELGNNRVRA